MKKYKYLFVLLAINILCFTNNNNNNMTTNIIVTVTNKQGKNLLNGIIQVTLAIRNNTNQDISVLLPYPNPNGFSFDSQSSILKKKFAESELIERTVPLKISSGKTYEADYFLNRYFYFINEGQAKISYVLYTTVEKDFEPTPVVYNGNFSIELQNASEEELRKQFLYYSNNLKSDNRKIRMEATEALSFVDNPLCIDYIHPMLSIENLEIAGINALCRFNTEQVQKLILEMLSHKESGVVSAAIVALQTLNVPIPRIKFIDMLSSQNASIRLIGLENLELNPDIHDKIHIYPLLKDFNPIIVEKAKKYYSLLQELKN
jgi:hypothetical protein